MPTEIGRRNAQVASDFDTHGILGLFRGKNGRVNTRNREGLATEPLLKADGVRDARATAELASARTPQLNHALAAPEEGDD